MCQHGEITGPRREAISWDNDVRKALALCNDLVPLHRSMLAGPQDEKQAFKSVEASFVVRAPALLYSLHYSTLCTLYTTLYSALYTPCTLYTMSMYTLKSVHAENSGISHYAWDLPSRHKHFLVLRIKSENR